MPGGPNPKKTERALASDYGYALSFLKSVPEIYHIFQQALKKGWTADKFVSQIKNTKWYKTHGETARTNAALKKTDPATYRAQYLSQLAQVRDKARQLGAVMTDGQLRTLTLHSMDFGFNDSQLGDAISGFINVRTARGEANSNLEEMRQAAYRNGIKLSDSTYQNWVRSIATGNHTVQDFQDYARKHAMSLAPGYADQLKAGMDLHDLAQPFMQSMASTLELNPSEIDLFDPTIRKAMSATDKDGKPATSSLWQFEQSLRQDHRWLGTQNAQNEVMATAHKVIQDMGFGS